MRKAINENPKAQMAVIGALLVVFGFFLLTKVMKKDPEPAPVDPNVPLGATSEAGATPSPTGSAPVSTPSSAPPPAAPTAGSPVPASAESVDPEALEPGPGMPPEFAAAWDRGNAIVLLIIKPSAADDKLVLASVARLSEPSTSVFVVPANKIARYSRITQGVGVSRVPALVVVRPRRVSSVPQAEVSYGFRNAGSVVQAVRDALYSGRDDLPYSPG
jgi:hypothetical protein